MYGFDTHCWIILTWFSCISFEIQVDIIISHVLSYIYLLQMVRIKNETHLLCIKGNITNDK